MKQAFGVNIPQTLEDVCDRARLALLVYDMQVGIVGQLRGAEAVTARVARVLETARQSGVRVFFTRHMSLPRELMGAFQYRMAMAWQRVDDPARVEPWFLRDSPGFAIVPELTPRPSEAIFDKLAIRLRADRAPCCRSRDHPGRDRRRLRRRPCRSRATLLRGVALCRRRHHDRYRGVLRRAREGMIPKSRPSRLTRGWKPVFGKDHAKKSKRRA